MHDILMAQKKQQYKINEVNDMQNLEYELRKCKECSCSRCNLNGTNGCYIEVAIKEINRYEQAFDSMKTHKYDECDTNEKGR